MKVTKNEKTKNYVCVFLKAGYFETGILDTFFRTALSNDLNLPAYFWIDNCDYDPVANCYQFCLPILDHPGREEEVYIPREYVLLVCVLEGKDNPAKEMGKVGFKIPTGQEVALHE